ncbi:MAG: PhoH family protein [Candidatus Eisenbacteria bacterium]|nr:PhoH family protein [Candidatus Eisenbacteria bacterium]
MVEVDPLHLFGQNDRNLRLIQDSFPQVRLVARGGDVYIEGDGEEVARIETLLLELLSLVKQGKVLQEGDVRYAVQLAREDRENGVARIYEPHKQYFKLKRSVRPKTLGQEEYVEALARFDIVFAVGPAGTGKTYLAVAAAVSAIRSRQKNRIVLVRPAVEAGESLGFLPGDFQEKVDPYLRPLYDALHDLMGADRIQRSLDMGILEVAPLAYMRGRTLNDAFVILDEAQNTTIGQMKMFLTRLGNNSRAVITGDVTQVDLPDAADSGLIRIQPILRGIPEIQFCYLTDRDVVRHHLVQRIIRAFDNHDPAAPAGNEVSEERPERGE